MLNPPHDQSRPYRTRFFIHLHLPAPFAIRVRHATTGSYACFASQPATSSTRQLSLHIDVTLRLLPLSLITQQQHCVGMPVPLRRLYIFKFSDYPRPAMCIRACHTLIATAIDRILHVYLPALSYDILRHMSGYVRLLLLTYLLSPRTHAFLVVITSFLSLDLRRYCFLFFSSRPDALELLFAFVIRTPPSCSRNAWRCSVSYLLLQHQIPLPPAPSRAATKADILLACIFLIRAANSTYLSYHCMYYVVNLDNIIIVHNLHKEHLACSIGIL